uniref:F-box domain-containing protein n=1 Tax=Meloidogyne hapla TaxID=6305 RepID=A0A1I8B5C8_MELHA
MIEPVDVWHLNQIEEHLAPNLLSLGLFLNKKSDLLKIATSCPNLEHLDFFWDNYIDYLDSPVDARQLELFCEDSDRRWDDIFFEVLINLNSINPLRKLIFDFLNFKEKIKIERVCKEWKNLCWNLAWVDFKDLILAKEDLLLCEELENTKKEINQKIIKLNEELTKRDIYLLVSRRKTGLDEYKKLICNPSIYKVKRPSRSLGVFSAIIHRCASNLEFLCIDKGIEVSTRIGRYFHFLEPSLKHFSMIEPIDVWHLNQIEEHLAPNLLSLGLVLNKKSDLLKISSSCPNLEHLDFCWKNYVYDLEGPVDARQLEALYSFKKLSSLSIEIYIVLSGCINESMPFHRLSCNDGNINFDDFLLELLINLNSITPLRALETFKCTLNRFDELMNINEFFQKLDKILKENDNKLKASYHFLNRYYSKEPDIIFKWKKGYLFELIKIPQPHFPYKYYIFGNSIVLKEILNETFGKRKTFVNIYKIRN